ncbi:MAG TPA: carbohydrate-binding family V/XII [Cellvibrio sp.]|nr:carbohydrate-binding family V/XII [Cellvibrio sp.]
MSHHPFLLRLLQRIAKPAITLFLIANSLLAQAIDWPQEIDIPEGKIVIYQLQPEELTGNIINGRAAMSLEPNNGKPAIFGAFWFSARIDTDTDAGTALVRDLKVTRVSWPDSTEENEARFTKTVESALPKNGYPISLERLSASLKAAEQEKKSLDGLKNDPPNIVFSQELAVLLSYDGTPRFSAIENTPYKRALNTRFAVVQDTKNNLFYLTGGNLWYSAKSATGPWTITQSPPADLVKMAPKADPAKPKPAKPPKVVTATIPTELISTDGKPKWKSLPGGKLLYVENTETPWLREIASGKMYILLSGRWFNSNTENGPWVFVRPDKLPASFKEIPPESDIGGLRASVAGTEEADDALLDAQIPVTTAVKRSEAKLTVTYDGAPKFEKISGTAVSYAVNTPYQVLLINNRYYAVDSGVWFTATAATGPWTVADKVPKEEISKIPPSSPVYNVTYVDVYESTPEVVYVGYTAGYTGAYPYYGAPYYGTGYYYPPYWGSYYYPYPPTWGLHVGYNPYTGWNVGLSWSNGFFSVGIGWSQGWNGNYPCCRNGCWEGADFDRNVINTGDINIGNSNSGNRDRINHNNRTSNRTGVANTANNLYQRPENRARNADRATTNRNIQQARSVQRDNNVFADKSGNVARRVGNEWQVRDKGTWSSSISERDFDTQNRMPERTLNDTKNKLPDTNRPSTTDRQYTPPKQTERAQTTQTNRTQSTRTQIDRQDLNRSYESRQHGTARQMSRPMGGGRMGGGGGRR